jgi:hypothetical protein
MLFFLIPRIMGLVKILCAWEIAFLFFFAGRLLTQISVSNEPEVQFTTYQVADNRVDTVDREQILLGCNQYCRCGPNKLRLLELASGPDW